MKVKRSLYKRLTVNMTCLIIFYSVVFYVLSTYQATIWLFVGVTTLAILVMLATIKQSLKPLNEMISALELGAMSLKANDFSVTIHNEHYKELTVLVENFNNLSSILREERLFIFQREQLLNRVIQEVPVALILTDNHDRIILSNVAAKTLLDYQKRLDGELLLPLIEKMPSALHLATINKQSGLYSETLENEKISYSLTCHQVSLSSKKHHLFLYKNLTQDMFRKESDIWKKAIRLISHELNNTLAPIKSLTNSAKKIIKAPEHLHMLPNIFDTIGDRIENLHEFLIQYATYARLPAPKRKLINLSQLVKTTGEFMGINTHVESEIIECAVDKTQIEQALLNLIKNAKESESSIEHISLTITTDKKQIIITVKDAGHGMNGSQLQQALLPFYTTKNEGSGLGLALSNDIVMAHHGKLRLSNRERDNKVVGFCVELVLPKSI